jgi:hypothetical protein
VHRQRLPLLILAHNGFSPVAGDNPYPGEDCYTLASFAFLLELGVEQHVALFGHWHKFSAWGPAGAPVPLIDDVTGETMSRLAELPGAAYINVGAPMQHTWGDAGQIRGWCDLCWSGNGWLLEQHPSGAPRFLEAGNAARPCDLVRARSAEDAAAAEATGARVVEVLPPPPPPLVVRSDLSLADTEEQTLARWGMTHILNEAARARVVTLGQQILGEARG